MSIYFKPKLFIFSPTISKSQNYLYIFLEFTVVHKTLLILEIRKYVPQSSGKELNEKFRDAPSLRIRINQDNIWCQITTGGGWGGEMKS